MSDFENSRFSKFQNSEHTGSGSTERHEEYHGPTRSRPWIIAAIVLGLVGLFVALLALNPTENDDPPAGIALREIIVAHV